MYRDWNNPKERKAAKEALTGTISNAEQKGQEDLNRSFTWDDMKQIEAVLERQEEIIEEQEKKIEDLEERIAIISEGEKHGHWIGDSYGYTCSACGKNMAEIADSDDYTFYKTSAYCPFCGAMMDEPPKEGEA